jgi:heme/copper-type cytochrome/quinol oxidase subunit 1
MLDTLPRVIDVRFVIAHSLWVFGAAIILAAFSYYDWLAKARGRRLREVLREVRGWRLSVAAGLLLVASGFLLMESTRWWERGVWLVVWAGLGSDLWRMRRRS